MTQMILKQGYITPDGQSFTTAQEARDHMRKPLVEAALLKLSGGDKALATFLYDQEDEIMKSFEVGVVSRVTKSERKKLEKALEVVKGIPDGKLKFIQDNSAALLDSFRWPGVKRLNDEQKASATLESLTKLAEPKAAAWIVTNKDAILMAFEAGVEKRVVNPKAVAALELARAKRTADSNARKAAEVAAATK